MLKLQSDALVQLQKTYTVIRYYVPADFRDELARIAEEVLGAGRNGSARARVEARP